jgi:hypothetical protein
MSEDSPLRDSHFLNVFLRPLSHRECGVLDDVPGEAPNLAIWRVILQPWFSWSALYPQNTEINGNLLD